MFNRFWKFGAIFTAVFILAAVFFFFKFKIELRKDFIAALAPPATEIQQEIFDAQDDLPPVEVATAFEIASSPPTPAEVVAGPRNDGGTEPKQMTLEEIQEKVDYISEQIDILKAQKAQTEAQNMAQRVEPYFPSPSPSPSPSPTPLPSQTPSPTPLPQTSPSPTPALLNQQSTGGGGNSVIYPKILISEVQVFPIEQRFIKLYNPNDSAVDLTGWYLQRKTQTADSFSSLVSSTHFENKTIQAHGYFLIAREIISANILMPDLTLSPDNSLILKDPGRNISDQFQTPSATPTPTPLEASPLTGQAPTPTPSPTPVPLKNILISEVQILPISQRFVELYNPNSKDIDLTGWYIQRKTQTATSWSSFVSSTNFSGKTILAYSYFIISREITGSDILLAITLSDNNSLVLKNKDGEIQDKLGWGQAQDFEISPALNFGSGFSLARKAGDTDNNLADFETQNPTPKQQNISPTPTPTPTPDPGGSSDLF